MRLKDCFNASVTRKAALVLKLVALSLGDVSYDCCSRSLRLIFVTAEPKKSLALCTPIFIL